MALRPSTWIPEIPRHPLIDRWMSHPGTCRVIDLFVDRLSEAFGEIQRIEAEAEQEIHALQQRVRELEARFLEDSHNSSRPPSSDGLKKNPSTDPSARQRKRTRSLRERNGKSPGGQPGHPGQCLGLEDNPDRVVISPVHRCAQCGIKLTQAHFLQFETRQVHDLHQGKRWVVEFRAEMKLCPRCGSMNHGGFPPEAQAFVCFGPEVRRVALYFMIYQLIPVLRVREIFQDLFELHISEGALHLFAMRASRELNPWEEKTRKLLIRSKVAHFDETGIRCQGKTQWLHEASTTRHTLYCVHEKRGHAGISALGVLPGFKGVAVHDGWAPYWRYRQEGLTHALCNAHHLRELNFVYELDRDSWALEMKELLKSALHHLHRSRELGKKWPRPRWIHQIEARYDSLLKRGYRAYGERMPKHPRAPRAGPHQKRDAGHNLVNRLHVYKRETLAFLRDRRVPFTNSQAERDIRMAKLKQKISGCFRSRGGARSFFRIRSFLSTSRKQGKNAYLALAEIFPPIDYSVLPEPT